MICSPRFVLELDIIFCNKGKIPSDAPAEFLSMSVLGEIVMICEYLDRVLCFK